MAARNAILHSMHVDARRFNISFSHSAPSIGAKHQESVMETFYRFRLTKSVVFGPDLGVSNHPKYASRAYTAALLGMRMRSMF